MGNCTSEQQEKISVPMATEEFHREQQAWHDQFLGAQFDPNRLQQHMLDALGFSSDDPTERLFCSPSKQMPCVEQLQATLRGDSTSPYIPDGASTSPTFSPTTMSLESSSSCLIRSFPSSYEVDAPEWLYAGPRHTPLFPPGTHLDSATYWEPSADDAECFVRVTLCPSEVRSAPPCLALPHESGSDVSSDEDGPNKRRTPNPAAKRGPERKTPHPSDAKSVH